MFILSIMLCSSFELTTCQVIAKPELHRSHEACMTEAQEIVDLATEAGLPATVVCTRLKDSSV